MGLELAQLPACLPVVLPILRAAGGVMESRTRDRRSFSCLNRYGRFVEFLISTDRQRWTVHALFLSTAMECCQNIKEF